MQDSERLPQTIGGYRIVRRLAREATVDVLLASSEQQPGRQRNVILKLVSPAFRGDATFDQTFSHETQAIAQLDHPCIVRLFDVFSAPDIKAMVLEYVDGPTLSELRTALIARGESLPDAAVYGIGAALFSGLAIAHAARDPQTGNLLPIVHRDVHPGQVLVAADGSVKLAGFGLERITGVRGDARATEARGYLPPEKARGEAVTTRSDVYATMLIVWELLARRRAVRDDALPEQELARALAQPTIVSLEVLRPEVPALVRSIVSRGLEPLVERRTVTAEEAASIFRSAASPEDARQALAQMVARAAGPAGAKSPAPPRAREPSLPSFPLNASSQPPGDASAGGADKRMPPRPSPRRMWGSSPTLTPAGSSIVSPPSSRMGSIPDARFSQDADRVSGMPPAPPPASQRPPTSQRPPVSRPPTPPPASARPEPVQAAPQEPAARPQQAFGNRTQAGGFDMGALRPLIGTPAPAPPPPPPPQGIGTLDTAPAFGAGATPPPPPMREPAASLPGMGVPLLAPTPGPAMVAPSHPPPAAPDGAPFWSVPPAGPPGLYPDQQAASAVPTFRPPKPASRGSITTLAIGLFFVAAAVGAGGFVAAFRRHAATSPGPTVKPATSASVAAPALSVAAAPPKASASAAIATPSALPTPSASTAAAPPKASASAAPAASVSAVASVTPVEKLPPAATAIEKLPTATPAGAAAAKGAPEGGATATLSVDKKAAGHRIFFDGRVIGEGEGPFTVPCGKHTVKVGSRGKPQAVTLPCGGELAVSK